MTALDRTATDPPPSGAPANGVTVTGVPAVGMPSVRTPVAGTAVGGTPAVEVSAGNAPAVDAHPADVLAGAATGAPDGSASCGAYPGSPESPAAAGGPGSGEPARTASLCTMAATAGDLAPARSTRDGSVPRPRGGGPTAENGRDIGAGAAGGTGGELDGADGPPAQGVSGGALGAVESDVDGRSDSAAGTFDSTEGAFDASGQTAARIRAGLAARLRTAHGQGRSLAELAAACRRPVAEIRALLAEGLGADAAGPVAGPGAASATGTELFVLLQAPPSTPTDEQNVPVLRAAQAELRTVLSRRPSPSRRLRRMHPEAGGPGEPKATPRAGAGRHAEAAAPPVPSSPRSAEPEASDPPVGTVGPAAGDAAGGDAETPLGILIGGTPHLPEAAGRPGERQPVRVAAEPVRIGRGTSLVILPAWRPAIAVSVPTDHLLSATGLAVDQLADAQLSVLINPGALHDRELDPHGWQAGPAGRTGRGG
ncbi:hypothetical protein [Kitasatospora sp. NPDC059327]|uniref:hypothetical protein n=1 Tax=Kitasatospora sp. NPDC059327 TaxID=3346803 RepID=UPI0036A30828